MFVRIFLVKLFPLSKDGQLNVHIWHPKNCTPAPKGKRNLIIFRSFRLNHKMTQQIRSSMQVVLHASLNLLMVGSRHLLEKKRFAAVICSLEAVNRASDLSKVGMCKNTHTGHTLDTHPTYLLWLFSPICCSYSL